jgi:hypothetical protein
MPTLQSDKAKTGQRAARELANHLRGQIQHGQMRPGDRVLSERKLAQRYDAPLHTVRLALSRLKAEGALVSRPKSGLYVASEYPDLTIGTAATPFWPPRHFPASGGFLDPLSEPAAPSIAGFNLLDPHETAACEIHFLVANWDRFTRRFWEQGCGQYSDDHSPVQVEASFPSNRREYRRLRPWSDAFISTHMEMYKGGRLWSDIEPFEAAELQAAGVDQRYIDAVGDEQDGLATGVPISACLMTGLLNTRLLPDRLLRPLQSAVTWDEVFDLLTEAAAARPGCAPLNVHGAFTFNIHQYLTVAAGGLLHEGRINLRRPAVRGALDRMDRFLEQTASRPAPDQGRTPFQSCLAEIDYTCRAALMSQDGRGWIPWLYPLGEGGRYLEGINIGFINRASPQRDPSRDFLLHLALPRQQQWITRSPREQSISARMPSPWQAYGPREGEILAAMRRQAVVFGEWVPGYVRAVEEVLPALSKQWVAGRLSTDEYCRLVEERGNECLDACQREAAL